jgi:hypothetical protein
MMSRAAALDLEAPTALVLQLLEWVAARPRTYRDTMEAWRTSCPRLPVWEDALANGLVTVLRDVAGELSVELTDEGRAFQRRQVP